MKCPFCNEESFAKKKLLKDGWKIVGEVEICALCGKTLPDKKEPAATRAAASTAGRAERLAALLGGDEREKVSLAGSADYSFCKNCRHFIIHPFRTFCALTDQEADPMGSCGKFTAKEQI